MDHHGGVAYPGPMERWDWDVWPADTTAARIASGTTSERENAESIVEAMLALHDGASFGQIERLAVGTFICRRTYVPGKFLWMPASATA